MTEENLFLTPGELAKRWKKKVSVETLERWRYSKTRKGPAYMRIGGKVLYSLTDIEEYERTNKINQRKEP